MEYQEILDANYRNQLPTEISSIDKIQTTYGDVLSINGFSLRKTISCKKYKPEGGIYDIDIKHNNVIIGTYCLLSHMKCVNLSEMTEPQRLAYIYLASMSDVLNGVVPHFSEDCLVIEDKSLMPYLENSHSSAIWGGFIESKDTMSLEHGRLPSNTASIDMISGYLVRTDRHRECLARAARAEYCTERFLHLYHYLELDYDYQIVSDIRKIDENNPKELWDILKSPRSDIDRLHYVSKVFSDISFIERLFSMANVYEGVLIEMLYEYDKESNPLKDVEHFKEVFLCGVPVTRNDADRIKKDKKFSDNFAFSDVSYNEKLLKIMCYIIYRTRCGIAHNKLGEYNISSSDYDFVVNFAEPLIVSLIRSRMLAEHSS
ncbi:hypothetical protein ACK39B_20510 [Aeromonas veronii]